jgi:cyanophycinase
MSKTMFIDVPDVLGALQNGIKLGGDTGPGLGFAGNQLLIDQHFLKRGRIGRLLPAMSANSLQLGLGVEEDTAAVICDNAVEVVGAKGALVVDLSQATHRAKAAPYTIKGARLTLLDHGDRWDIATGKVTVSAVKLAGNKLDHTARDFKPYNTSAPFYPDLLGDGTLANALTYLVDSRAAELRGLAFRPSANARNIGFEFRLHKGGDTLGYFTSGAGREAYSVQNVYLDVTPVLMAAPLYRPLDGAAPKPAQGKIRTP